MRRRLKDRELMGFIKCLLRFKILRAILFRLEKEKRNKKERARTTLCPTMQEKDRPRTVVWVLKWLREGS